MIEPLRLNVRSRVESDASFPAGRGETSTAKKGRLAHVPQRVYGLPMAQVHNQLLDVRRCGQAIILLTYRGDW